MEDIYFLLDHTKELLMRLNSTIYVLVALLLLNCNDSPKEKVNVKLFETIASNFVNKSELELNSSNGQWFYKNQPFNGYAVSYYENENLAEKTGYFNGKREGQSYSYFNDGTVKKYAFYSNNKLEGKKRTYFENGVLASESNYFNGIAHGIQKTWFANGQLAKKRVLNKGKEEGLQQSWLENGKLYVNYEAKDGRIYGMRRANSCYKLEDEVVIKR